MNAKARNARRIVKARRTEARDAVRTHTLASHARRAGMDETTASSVGGALRTRTTRCGVTGEAARLFRRNQAGQKLWRKPVAHAKRYTRKDVAALVADYKPRAARFVEARELLLAYTA